jgi:hypothetical protein
MRNRAAVRRTDKRRIAARRAHRRWAVTQVVTHSARNGFVYTMERANGAKPYVDNVNRPANNCRSFLDTLGDRVIEAETGTYDREEWEVHLNGKTIAVSSYLVMIDSWHVVHSKYQHGKKNQRPPRLS